MNDQNTQIILDAINSMKNDINKKFDSIDAHLAIHDDNFKDINNELTSLGNIVTRMEAELETKVQIVLEYASISMEKFDNLQKTIDNINSKIITHDLHIEVLEEKVL